MVVRRHKIIFLLLMLAGACFVFLAQKWMSDYMLSLVNFIGIYIILAVSLNITNGFSGLFSLGHPAFMAIGGYTAAILTFPVRRKAYFLEGLPGWLAQIEAPFLPSLLVGGIMASLAALIVGVPVLRLRGHYLAVATLGVLIIVQVLITNFDSVTRGPLGLNGLPGLTTLWWVYLWAVFTIFVSWRIKFSSYGRTMLAVREDEMAAQCSGVDLFRTRVAALVIGAFFAGVAGGLWAHLVTAITPKSFSMVLAFHIVVMVVVGGSGSITGSVAAAIVFSVMTEFFRPLEESLSVYGMGEIFMALVMISILIYRPSGLFGTREPRILAPDDV
jgi:branched-chain amino acid transport system permease protein